MMLGNSKSLVAISLLLILTSCLNSGGGGSDVAITSSSASSTAVVSGPAVLSATITSISQGAIDGLVTVSLSGANPFSVGSVVSITGTAAYNRAAPLAYTIVSVTPSSFVIAVAEAGDETPVAAIAQGGGGVVGACSTTVTAGTAGQIGLSYTASRYSGVAPLAVFFDATATTAVGTSKPFHDRDYTWTFGDGGSGSWANGARPGSSRNVAKGPLAAHIFETPGLYTVSLSVTDGTNTVANNCVQIAVQDPDIVFDTTKTVCIANVQATAGLLGCPNGAATPAGTNDFDAALAACVGPNKRCLFKAGDTFISSSPGIVGSAGAITIGAYPTTPPPVTPPLINSTNVNLGVIDINNAAVNDLRIMDLEIVGSGGADTGVGIVYGANVSNVAVLRVNIHDIGKGFVGSGTATLNGSVIQDTTVADFCVTCAATGANAFFGRLSTSAILGNNWGPAGAAAEHVLRAQRSQKTVISHNTLTTPGSNDGGKQALAIRADVHTTAADDTNYVVASFNKVIGTSTSIASQIQPSAGSENALISDVIVDSNWFVGDAATTYLMKISAARVTVRNNVCDMSGRTVGAINCFSPEVSTNGVVAVAPANVEIYNNTFYASNSIVNRAIWLDATATASIVKNNLCYFPTGTGLTTCLLDQAAGTTKSNNTGDGGTTVFTNPLFISVAPFTPANAKPTGASYAIGTNNACAGGVPCGTSVPVWTDFFLTSQPSPRDMGAVNH